MVVLQQRQSEEAATCMKSIMFTICDSPIDSVLDAENCFLQLNSMLGLTIKSPNSY